MNSSDKKSHKKKKISAPDLLSTTTSSSLLPTPRHDRVASLTPGKCLAGQRSIQSGTPSVAAASSSSVEPPSSLKRTIDFIPTPTPSITRTVQGTIGGAPVTLHRLTDNRRISSGLEITPTKKRKSAADDHSFGTPSTSISSPSSPSDVKYDSPSVITSPALHDTNEGSRPSNTGHNNVISYVNHPDQLVNVCYGSFVKELRRVPSPPIYKLLRKGVSSLQQAKKATKLPIVWKPEETQPLMIVGCGQTIPTDYTRDTNEGNVGGFDEFIKVVKDPTTGNSRQTKPTTSRKKPPAVPPKRDSKDSTSCNEDSNDAFKKPSPPSQSTSVAKQQPKSKTNNSAAKETSNQTTRQQRLAEKKAAKQQEEKRLRAESINDASMEVELPRLHSFGGFRTLRIEDYWFVAKETPVLLFFKQEGLPQRYWNDFKKKWL